MFQAGKKNGDLEGLHRGMFRDQFILIVPAVKVKQMVRFTQYLTGLIQHTDVDPDVILFGAKCHIDQLLMGKRDVVDLGKRA